MQPLKIIIDKYRLEQCDFGSFEWNLYINKNDKWKPLKYGMSIQRIINYVINRANLTTETLYNYTLFSKALFNGEFHLSTIDPLKELINLQKNYINEQNRKNNYQD